MVLLSKIQELKNKYLPNFRFSSYPESGWSLRAPILFIFIDLSD